MDFVVVWCDGGGVWRGVRGGSDRVLGFKYRSYILVILLEPLPGDKNCDENHSRPLRKKNPFFCMKC